MSVIIQRKRIIQAGFIILTTTVPTKEMPGPFSADEMEYNTGC